MSNTCFSCHAKIKEDSYGLTQCPDCHTFVFIDFEGHVQKPPEKVQESEEPHTSHQDPVYEPQKQDEISNDLKTPLDSSHQSDTTDYPQEAFQATDSHSKQEFPINPIETNLSRTSPIETHPLETSPLETSPVESSVGTNPVETNPVEASLEPQFKEADSLSFPKNNQLQEVVDYANRSEDTSGGFYYNVMISGIDSKALRQSVMDALDDPRFGWKKEDMAALIKNGCLAIEKINSAKTYILMSYLKFLPLKIKWDQVSFIK